MIFLGREIAQHRDYSEATAIEIDREVKRFVDEAYDRAMTMLKEHREELESIAEALLQREVLDGKEVQALLEGRTLPEPEVPAVPESAEKPARDAEEKPSMSPGPIAPKPSEGLGSA